MPAACTAVQVAVNGLHALLVAFNMRWINRHVGGVVTFQCFIAYNKSLKCAAALRHGATMFAFRTPASFLISAVAILARQYIGPSCPGALQPSIIGRLLYINAHSHSHKQAYILLSSRTYQNHQQHHYPGSQHRDHWQAAVLLTPTATAERYVSTSNSQRMVKPL